jgi:hypothetical protein
MQATAPVSVPPPQVMTKAANPSIPTQMSAEQSLSAGETVVPIVNNSVTTIGGQPPKVIQTSTARPRNNDLNRYLSNIAVPV